MKSRCKAVRILLTNALWGVYPSAVDWLRAVALGKAPRT